MIPGPLLDRMEMIEMSSYTREEKWHIARRHLLPKQMKKHGLTSSMLKVSKSALYALIDGYTREAGVRQLERELASVCRKAARKIVSGDAGSVSVTGKNLAELLGVPRYIDSAMEREDLVGVVNGLAWTSVGGEMLEIETIILPGNRQNSDHRPAGRGDDRVGPDRRQPGAQLRRTVRHRPRVL